VISGMGWNTVIQVNLPVSVGCLNVTSDAHDTIRVVASVWEVLLTSHEYSGSGGA